MQTLPLARYRCTWRMAETLRLPEYSGSELRSLFGVALRKVSCTTGASTCTDCPLRASCAYSTVFEAPAPASHRLQQFSDIPKPYLIEPPPIGTTRIAAGEALSCNLLLFGNALEHLPLIRSALQGALERELGDKRASGVLESIEVQQASAAAAAAWTSIWRRGDRAIAPHEASISIARIAAPRTPTPDEIRLVFDTPLCLQRQGKRLRAAELSPRKLLADLLRRISLLAELHAGQTELVPKVSELVHLASTLEHRHELQWRQWPRYSHRQKRKMTLGGVVGSWTLRGPLGPLLPWLELGQWLHVGKNTSFGFGRYRLDTAAD